MLSQRNTHENSDSESGFFDSRIFVAVVFCLTGGALGLLASNRPAEQAPFHADPMIDDQDRDGLLGAREGDGTLFLFAIGLCAGRLG